MNVAALVDAAVTERVLVFGSLPPYGRDLDVLVRPSEERSVVAALSARGLEVHGEQWISFAGCSIETVDVVRAVSWGLGDPETAALFSEAGPIEGFHHLVRPAPHHALLILARRVVRDGGELDDKRRRRAEDAIAEDADAWDRARERAAAWGATRALGLLENLYKTGVPIPAHKRASAIAEGLRHRGTSRIEAGSRSWRMVLHRPRGKVVSFSGLDGSGKTTQAHALREAIVRGGGDAVVVWNRLSYNPSLRLISRPIKGLLSMARVPTSDGVDHGKDLRRRSVVLTHLWATIVATTNGVAHRRVAGYHLRRGRVVICDRYILDSCVHLRYRYGSHRRFWFQTWIVKWLSPRPGHAFFIDVPAAVARDRKKERYDLDQLDQQIRLYRNDYASLGVVRLDGTRGRDELCAEVARRVLLHV